MFSQIKSLISDFLRRRGWSCCNRINHSFEVSRVIQERFWFGSRIHQMECVSQQKYETLLIIHHFLKILHTFDWHFSSSKTFTSLNFSDRKKEVSDIYLEERKKSLEVNFENPFSYPYITGVGKKYFCVQFSSIRKSRENNARQNGGKTDTSVFSV